MRRAERQSLRAALWLLPALMIGSVWAGGPAVAEPVATEKKEEERPRITCSPQVEAKLVEYMKAVTEAKRKLWNLRMDERIDEVAKVTGLDAAGKSALEAPARMAVDQSLGTWTAKAADILRRFLNEAPDQAFGVLEQLRKEPEEFAADAGFVSSYALPGDSPAWTEGLKRTLTPEQFAAWNKAQAEHDLDVENEIGPFLKAGAESNREQKSKSILPKTMEVKRVLALSGERAAKVDALAQSTLDKITDDWRKQAEKLLLSMDGDTRRQALGNGQFSIEFEEEDIENGRRIWTDGLARILSPADLERWNAVEEEHRSRRIRAMGRMMLAELDGKIAFTASQRRQLEPVAERLEKNSPFLFSEDESDIEQGMMTQTFLSAGANATEAEMKPILDAVQWEHWKEACMEKGEEAEFSHPQTTESDDPESSISDFMQERTALARTKLLAPMLLKAEDAARTAALPPGAASQLQIAARGVAEKLLAAWRSDIERAVRIQIGDATASAVKERLEGMGNNFLEDAAVERLLHGKQKIWDTAVNTALTAGQRAAWQKEVDERRAYREKSIALAIMAEFDRENPVSAEQWDKLQTVLDGTMEEYGPDIDRLFSSRWYQRRNSIFIPLACAPEKDLKAILSTDQWETWTGSDEFANTTSYASSIHQIHEQRMKAAR